MKCEICHKADVAAVIRRKEPGGTERELYVCKACAAENGKRPAGHDGKNAAGKPAKMKFSVEEGEPPPFVENFVKAALGLVEGFAEQSRDSKACPGCGRTWEKIKEERRVGCPRCYRAFAELIREEFLGGAYGQTHVGEMPPSAATETSGTREWLEQELKKAVKNQHFEKAAELRRRIDALGGDGEKRMA